MDEASLSLKRLCGGVWEGELLHWGPWEICWRALVMGHHFARDSIRGPEGSFMGEPER